MRHAVLVLLGVVVVIGTSGSEEVPETKGPGLHPFHPQPLESAWGQWLGALRRVGW